jgi:carboxyl-terminal processing protease
VDTSGNQLVIIGPMPDSPAEKVGIMPGDIVIGIDGEDVSGLDPNLVLKKILGPEGTSIHITIQRNGKSLEFDLERATIQVPSVESQLMENNTGYIRLYYFAVNSAVEIENAYENLQDQGATKLILDLRNNSGGYVDSAVKIASLFIDSGDILIEEWGDGTRNIYHHTGHTMDADSPMVVLVNGGSASASEIVAGALQDYGRAKLIGTTTFGKGLIQNWIPLDNDFGAVRITIAHWLTPKGRQIQDQGLAPNISVPLTEEDIQNQYDRQLNRAIEYLNSVAQ